MEIKRTYVSFEQAKLLKEKGFEIPILNWYHRETKKLNKNDLAFSINKLTDNYSAPEQWKVVEWLRINHGIWIVVNITIDDKWYFELYNLKDKRNSEISIVDENITDFHNSPQKAYSAAFDYILKELI
jgi:hypothetical protein